MVWQDGSATTERFSHRQSASGSAGEISGVDLSKPMDERAKAFIIDALDRYGVVVARDQRLSQAELVEVGSALGELDVGVQKKFISRWQSRLESEALTDISNVGADGEVAATGTPMSDMNISNRQWHSDGSYADRPFRYSILSCVVPVQKGGETEFADLRAAYDSLAPDLKEFLSDKIGIFFHNTQRERLGFLDTLDMRMAYPPVRWPMVRTHPGSGRKLLWVDTKVCGIEGMSIPDARSLLDDLMEHIGQREHVYRHVWRPDDVVFWDNRSVLHRGRRFDPSERREMRRVGTLDDVHSLGEMPFETSPTSLGVLARELIQPL